METPTPSAVPSLNLDLLIVAIGHKTRWRLLKSLTHGEPRTVTELAEAAGCTYQNVSNHLQLLKKLGILVQGRGGLYQIPLQFLPAPGQPLLDCGHCLLRMSAVQ